jgi:hypothetical protein
MVNELLYSSQNPQGGGVNEVIDPYGQTLGAALERSGGEGPQYGYAGYGLGGYGTGTPTDVYGYSSPNKGYLESKVNAIGLGGLEKIGMALATGQPIGEALKSIANPMGFVNDLTGMYSKAAGLTQSPGTIGPAMASLVEGLGLNKSGFGKAVGGLLQGAPAQIAGMISPYGGLGLGLLDAALSLGNKNLSAQQKQAGLANFFTSGVMPTAAGMFAGPVGYMTAKALGPVAGYLGQLGAYNIGIPGIVDPGLWGMDSKTGTLSKSVMDTLNDYQGVVARNPGTLGAFLDQQALDKYAEAMAKTEAFNNPLDPHGIGCPDVGSDFGNVEGNTSSYGSDFGGWSGETRGPEAPGETRGPETTESDSPESHGPESKNETRGEGDI